MKDQSMDVFVERPQESIISLDTIKQYGRIDASVDDHILQTMIAVAEKNILDQMDLVISKTTAIIKIKSTPIIFNIPIHPIISITKITAENQKLSSANYVLNNKRIEFEKSFKNCEIELECGHTRIKSISPDIQMALISHIIHLYENRDGSETFTPFLYKNIISKYKNIKI